MTLLTRFRHDRRGVSALEMALVAPIMLALMGGVADFGIMWRDRGKLAAAVNAGAQYAVLAGTGAVAANVQTTITGAAGLSGVTATVTGPACYCVATTTSLSPATCGTPCAAGGNPGTYLLLNATFTYPPIMPLFSKAVSTTFTEAATVRVK